MSAVYAIVWIISICLFIVNASVWADQREDANMYENRHDEYIQQEYRETTYICIAFAIYLSLVIFLTTVALFY